MEHVDFTYPKGAQHMRSVIFNIGLAAWGLRPVHDLAIAHHRLRKLTKRATQYHLETSYRMPLHELPDEVLLGCVDGSMCLCSRLASTSKVLCERLQLAAHQHGLSLLVSCEFGGVAAAVLAAEEVHLACMLESLFSLAKHYASTNSNSCLIIASASILCV